ncbi:NAD-dependent epimerase/dehydratase family protein [Streptomyces lushanensis]|uniref:NAD-dependent epimerase/dehydratase family protein n=1 Tax=Streptomyces lushanensis TaxID=1434255 RepID=UPI0008344983|nr:NAD-dependent epimerase/dehydratase family protein [Streptomyces lushanensis]
MKVFITGGSGYVGRATVKALIRKGFEVTALARSDRSAQRVESLGATPVPGGLTDTGTLRAAAGEADGVIHLGQHYGADTAAVDFAASQALLDGLGGRGTYVHTGGVWVYGNTNGVVDENAPLNPPRLTSWRLKNEEQVRARASGGSRPVVVMPGLVYGHGEGLIDQFLVGPGGDEGTVLSIGDGRNHWALVHVDDVAELYVLALDAPAGSVYAGVSGQNIPLARIARAVAQGAGRAGRVTSLSLEEAEARMGPIAEAFALDQQFTGARAREELGWTPTRLDALTDLARTP